MVSLFTVTYLIIAKQLRKHFKIVLGKEVDIELRKTSLYGKKTDR